MSGIHPDLRSDYFHMFRTEPLTSGVLQSPAFGQHGILLDRASWQMVDVSGVIHLFDECAGCISCLLTSQDVKVVVRRMSPGVTLGPYSRAKDDEVSTTMSQALGLQ